MRNGATLFGWIGSPLFIAAAFTLGGCTDAPTRPQSVDDPAAGPVPRRVVGLVEVTLSGVNTDRPTASVISAPTVAALERLRAARAGGPEKADAYEPQAIGLPVNGDDSGDGSIQLEPISTGAFTFGERGDGGVRYLSATFRVRNAQAEDGTPYDTPRKNLTFYAVDTDGPGGTIGQTPITSLRYFDGTSADSGIAAEFIPTGAARLDRASGTVTADVPDVLQVLTEPEAAAVLALAPGEVGDVFPYGFVVRNPNDASSRELPAAPAEDAFDGLVTFAFKVPLQESPEDDPFTVSALFIAVDDDSAVVTQSFEEQDEEASAAFHARAAALGASMTLLPGGTEDPDGTYRWVCRVRTAGTAAAPVAYLATGAALDALSPDPYATDGSASAISATAGFAIEFGDVIPHADPSIITVRGLQSGPAFRGQAYAGAGTTTISTPAAEFLPGEEVEVVFGGDVACPDPVVARFRVEAGAAPAVFGGAEPYDILNVGGAPASLAVGELNGDDALDIVVANVSNGDVAVLLGNGDGTFQSAQLYDAGSTPRSIALGDLDGDGVLDIAAANFNSDNVSVLLGNGDGTFDTQATFAVGSKPRDLAIGDLDGDGVFDIVVAHFNSEYVSVLIGKGDGSFHAHETYPAGDTQEAIALGDLDGDGALDIAAAVLSGSVVLLGNGDGSFQDYKGVGAAGFAITIGDLDGDGIPDLVVAVLTPVYALLGNGDGTFQSPDGIGVGGGDKDMAIGDLNGDGIMDLVIADGGDSFIVLIRDGESVLPDSNDAYWAGGLEPTAVAVADLDGDGDLDIVGAARGSGVVAVRLNGFSAIDP